MYMNSLPWHSRHWWLRTLFCPESTDLESSPICLANLLILWICLSHAFSRKPSLTPFRFLPPPPSPPVLCCCAQPRFPLWSSLCMNMNGVGVRVLPSCSLLYSQGHTQ